VNSCAVRDCAEPVKARGLCNPHYMRWYKYGDPLHVPPPITSEWNLRPVAERFWSKVDFSNPDGCWLWAGSRRHEYGEVSVGGKSAYPHRVAFELVYGDLEPGLVVRHRCDNQLCVRPDHLVPGTQADNMRDVGERGRWRNQFTAGANNDADAWKRRSA
jgi:hypothetical protein